MPDATALATRNEVKIALNIDSGDTGYDAAIDALLPQVTALAERYTKRSLIKAASDVTELLDGTGHEILLLARYPVTNITSLHVSTGIPRVYDGTTAIAADTAYHLAAGSGVVTRVDGGVFDYGSQTVKAVYNGGFAIVPDELVRAACEIVSVKLYKGTQKQYHVTSESLGDGNVGGIRFDDIPETARLVLDRYKKVR